MDLPLHPWETKDAMLPGNDIATRYRLHIVKSLITPKDLERLVLEYIDKKIGQTSLSLRSRILHAVVIQLNGPEMSPDVYQIATEILAESDHPFPTDFMAVPK